jgi:hypothetical protein
MSGILLNSKLFNGNYNYTPPMGIIEGIKNNMIQNDVQGGMYPGIASLNHFVETFYGDLISLNMSGEGADVFTVSGINSSQGPINIEWYVNSTATAVDGTLIVNNADTCIPYLIAGYSSHINIRGGRQIELVS